MDDATIFRFISIYAILSVEHHPNADMETGTNDPIVSIPPAGSISDYTVVLNYACLTQLKYREKPRLRTFSN